MIVSNVLRKAIALTVIYREVSLAHCQVLRRSILDDKGEDLPQVKQITAWRGNIGSWSVGWSSSISGFYACGAKVRNHVEPCGDCSGINGIELKLCDIEDWTNQRDVTVFNGDWGDWAREFTMCEEGDFIQGTQVRYQDFIGSIDNIALNGLRILCGTSPYLTEEERWFEVNGGTDGEWKPPVIHRGTYVKAARVRYHPHCGWYCDDSALNGIMLLTETMIASTSPTLSPSVIPTNLPSSSPTFDFQNNVVTVWQGAYGSWTTDGWSPSIDDFYACGVRTKNHIERCTDCSGLSGIEIKLCGINDNWFDQHEVRVLSGEFGVWDLEFTMCSAGDFIQGSQIRYQDYAGPGDDFALNGLRILCGNSHSNMDDLDLGASSEYWIEVQAGSYGSWKPAKEHRGSYIKAAQTQYHKPCGWYCDDTQVNGLRFKLEVIVASSTPTFSPTYDFETNLVTQSFEWGEWSDTWTYGSNNEYYACGARVKSEHDWCTDCTGINSIEFKFCHIDFWHDQESILVGDGDWGSWKEFRMCKEGEFIEGTQVRNHDDTGPSEDDTALNGLRILCGNAGNDEESMSPEDPGVVYEEWLEVDPGKHGEWKQKVIHTGSYIKAARAKSAKWCGYWCDDIAMTGIQYKLQAISGSSSVIIDVYNTYDPTMTPSVSSYSEEFAMLSSEKPSNLNYSLPIVTPLPTSVPTEESLDMMSPENATMNNNTV